MKHKMIRMLELADITWQRCCYNFAQRHKGKYAFNNCTNRKSHQRNRNYKTDPNRNFRTKRCNVWNKEKKKKSLAAFNRWLEMTGESENIEDRSIEMIQSECLREKKEWKQKTTVLQWVVYNIKRCNTYFIGIQQKKGTGTSPSSQQASFLGLPPGYQAKLVGTVSVTVNWGQSSPTLPNMNRTREQDIASLSFNFLIYKTKIISLERLSYIIHLRF